MGSDERPHGSGRKRSRTNRTSTTSTRRTFMQAAGIGVGGLALGGFPGTATAVDNPTPRLETDGRWIVDPDGNRVKLRGFATASLEFIDYDWYPFTVEEVLEHGTDGETWHPNTVRLPITEDPVHEHGMEYVVEDLLRPAVDLLADRGVYAVIDLHLIRPYVDAMGNAEGMVEDGWADDISGLGFDANVETDELLTEFWSAVAPEFADDENVIFELYNEPTLPLTWADYGEYGADVETREDSWLLWRDAAQPWVDLIREEAPETPIIIGSPDWTSETQFAPEHPFEGENLIYASHIYPANGHPDEFDDEYGAPAEDVPVVVTEFGWDPDEEFEETVEYGTTSEWGEPVREWMESYDNMGWLGWCFDDTWAPTFFDSPDEGVGEPWTLKDDPEQQGWFIRQWLEETKDDMVPGGGNGEPEGPPAIDGTQPADTTGDGLHNDFTGSGSTTTTDVNVFFENIDNPDVADYPQYYDFDGNGQVSVTDVVELFESL
ncbi:glycoside hydrolase family 5 protein [Natronoglomus mannanivorans]|uniref:Glycoside hydrolase family 5 protein n=1 Tax=Natronoglomus mannanivorans TaxID=2979990 RepID=A0AAP2YXG1_9EURY|nr:glycoside hydrolase family 5 protein [Halobacteria archaeon AArc-xg1-1]